MNDHINPGTPWPATDALGRQLSLAEEVGPLRKDRFVGIFYFLFMSKEHDGAGEKVYNVNEIMTADPDALQKPDSPLWGPPHERHFWDEPLFGYYRPTDEWVIRRHAHMLSDAGIDTLIFDTTNTETYRDVYMKICEVFTQVRAEGGRTPAISFMVNTDAGKRGGMIYEDLYKPGHYADLWFQWQGKPLMICDPQEASAEMQEFFTLRKAHWPFTLVNTPYAWHWEAAYPQVYGYTDDPEVPEQVNVSVAQNLRASDGVVTSMSKGDARGRSFHDGKLDTTPGAVDHGHNFAEQWKRGLSLDPPFLMVTGWNEWIAGRFESEEEPVMFVDQFNQEFSRDTEPAKGAHKDNYYYQLIDGVRRYKGAPALPKAGPAKTIDLNEGFDQWQSVEPEYRDPTGETLPRDHSGVCGLHYENHTGRNEFVAMKVAHDATHLYFYAQTQNDITPCDDPHWMMLLLSVNAGNAQNWEGYDFIVNRTIEAEGRSALEASQGGWQWDKVDDVLFRVAGNQLQLAILRKSLGLTEGEGGFSIDFKWCDNMQQPGEIMDFYLSGDVAPGGRFKYRYCVE